MSSPAARPADVATLDAILHALYEVISGPAGQPRDWDRSQQETRMRLISVTAIFLLIGSALASAQQKTFHVRVGGIGTGESYVQYCPEIHPNMPFEEVTKANYCFGYVRGVIDYNSLLEVPGRHLFCSPKDIGSNEADAILRKYIKAHPDNLKTPTPALVALALGAEYPCPKANPPPGRK